MQIQYNESLLSCEALSLPHFNIYTFTLWTRTHIFTRLILHSLVLYINTEPGSGRGSQLNTGQKKLWRTGPRPHHGIMAYCRSGQHVARGPQTAHQRHQFGSEVNI